MKRAHRDQVQTMNLIANQSPVLTSWSEPPSPPPQLLGALLQSSRVTLGLSWFLISQPISDLQELTLTVQGLKEITQVTITRGRAPLPSGDMCEIHLDLRDTNLRLSERPGSPVPFAVGLGLGAGGLNLLIVVCTPFSLL